MFSHPEKDAGRHKTAATESSILQHTDQIIPDYHLLDLPDWDSFPQTLCTCSSASMHSHQTVQLIFSFLLLLVLESLISKGEKSRFFSLPFDL